MVDSVKFRGILQHVGFQKIKLIGDSLVIPKGMVLDFNSIAQGFTVDLIANYLQRENIQNYLIELGGELLSKGKNADGRIWRVGVDKPSENIDHNQRFQFILELEDNALATSGNYRKFYRKDGVKYSHVINPFTGFPANNKLLSATVLYANCMLADAYATAFMVMGLDKTKKFILQNPDIEVYLVYISEYGEWDKGTTYYDTSSITSSGWYLGQGTDREEHVHEGMETSDGGFIAIGHHWEKDEDPTGFTLSLIHI